MNTVLLTIILVPIIEIYLFIKIGSQIGAFNTISLIFVTALVGMIYARHEGLNTLKSGISLLVKNEIPRVREDFGFPPLVTPASQIVGAQALLNVMSSRR